MRKIVLICFSSLLFIISCKNELSLNAPWKDITIVYGILNQKDTAHYIKVNKAYLGEGNALIMATNPDSSSYFNNLEVIIEEWRNDQFTGKTIVFDTTTVYNKEAGTFYYPNQVIYKSKTKLDSVNSNVEYRLKITHKVSGKLITSKTKLVKPFLIAKPIRNPANPTVTFTNTSPLPVEFTIDKELGNSRYFEAFFRFYYIEQDTVSMVFSEKYLDFSVGNAVFNDIDETITMNYIGEAFYSMLKSKIPYNPNIIRKVKTGEEIELFVYAANDDFYTYLQAVRPSTGLIQEKPEFTNIENGYGIFASRLFVKSSYNLSLPSLDSLYSGSYTKLLNFSK